MSANTMKRRKFVQSLLATPAISAVAVEVALAAPPPATNPQQQPQPNTPVQQNPRQPSGVPTIDLTPADLTAEPAPHFFSETEFATLRKLGEVLMPPIKNNPGALEAKAPEFLDFLIGVSPPDRQKSYRFGLAELEKQARQRHQSAFASLNAAQIDAILRPLLVTRPWPEDMPDDPLKSFITQGHEDLRTATMNSREWADASEKSGRRFNRNFRGSGYYWFPIDPISQG